VSDSLQFLSKKSLYYQRSWKFRSSGDAFTSFQRVSLLFTDDNRILHCTMEHKEKRVMVTGLLRYHILQVGLSTLKVLRTAI
jgi:hypothetical protein